MSMSYADNFYTNNVDKIFETEGIVEGDKVNAEEFNREMDKLKNDELNRLWSVCSKLEEKLSNIKEALNSSGDHHRVYATIKSILEE